MRLSIIFRGIARCELGNGKSVDFWDDLWLDGVLAHKYPRLASFAKTNGISVFEVMQAEDLDTLFMLPLSVEAIDELEALQLQLHQMEYDQDNVDKWVPMWGSKYTSRKYYTHVFSSVEAHLVFKVIWQSRCTPRVKIFAWLILVDRLNTEDMLQRRNLNIEGSPICIMCKRGELETIEHLFLMSFCKRMLVKNRD
jgi:hypothetical protein